MSCPDFWCVISRNVERFCPFCGGIASLVWAFVLNIPKVTASDNSISDVFCDFLQTYITVSAIFVGLLTAANSNFASHSSEKIIDILRKYDFLKSICKYYRSAIISNMIGIIFSMCLWLILRLHSLEGIECWIIAFWFFIAGFSLFDFLRISYLYGKIIDKAHLFHE